MKKRFGFKTMTLGKDKNPNKTLLRKEIEIHTKEFLKSNKITVLPDSPNAKVPEVQIKELGQSYDSHQFYQLEEDDKRIHEHLNNI